MKNLLVLLLMTSCYSGFAQIDKNVSLFHRLIVYNSADEMMLVKIKNADVWVTPGFYQDSTQFIKEGLHDIAATYGMEISSPELKGIFSMRRDVGATKDMLLRNIYHCQYLSGEIHFPENQSFEIAEIKWLPINEALPLISFESIRLFIKQTHDNPNKVMGGSIRATKDGSEWKYEMVEALYPIFSSKKRKKKRKKD